MFGSKTRITNHSSDLVMRRVWRGGGWAALAVVAVVLDVLLCLDPLVLKPWNDLSVLSQLITTITVTIAIITTITTCILPLLSQFLSCTSSLSVTTRWLRLVNVVLKTVKNEWMKEWIIMTNRMVVFEVEIYLIELSPWSYNSSLGAVLSFSVPINNHGKNLIIDDLFLMTMLTHSEK